MGANAIHVLSVFGNHSVLFGSGSDQPEDSEGSRFSAVCPGCHFRYSISCCNYQFLAGVQLSLYAGGIVVLIIFSILLTHHISHKFERPPLLNLFLGLLAAVIGRPL